jgi:hypothetical protein
MVGYVKYLEDIPLFNIDLKCLRSLAERRGLSFNEISPLRQILSADEILNDGVDDDIHLWQLTQVLSCPKFVSQFTKAGLGEQTESFAIYGKFLEGKAFFAFVQEHQQERQTLLFDAVEELSTYVVSRYASMNTQAVSAEAGFDSDVDHFIFTLNVIDSIRRRYLTGLLSGKHIALEHITLQDYNAELDFNLKNSDVRWLLPSALRLVPKIHRYRIEFDPEKIEYDPNYKLVTKYQAEDQGEILFFLSDDIKKMGLDFTHHWKYALGFDFKDEAGDHGRYYLAPSDEINHFFELSEDGRCRYRTLGFNELLERLEFLFETAVNQ